MSRFSGCFACCFVAALLASAVTHADAGPAPANGDAAGARRPRYRGPRPQLAVAKMTVPAASVFTYGEYRQAAPGWHPSFELFLYRYAPGSTVQAAVQNPSTPMGLDKVSSAETSRAFGRAIAPQVRTAEMYSYLTTAALGEAPSAPQAWSAVAGPVAELPVGAPVLLTGRDLLGRRYREQHINVEPWPHDETSFTAHYREYTQRRGSSWDGSSPIQAYSPWLTNDLLIGVGSGQVTVAALRSALPRGSRVTMRNPARDGQPQTFVAGTRPGRGGHPNRLELAGEPGDRIEVRVEVGDPQYHNTTSAYFEVPDPAYDRVLFAKKGRSFLAAIRQPDTLAVTPEKLAISPAYAGPQGNRYELYWGAGETRAFSRGATVRVTNLSTGSSMTTTPNRESESIQLPGAITDRLKIEIYYPGQEGETKTFYTVVPRGEGTPVRVTQGRKLYPARLSETLADATRGRSLSVILYGKAAPFRSHELASLKQAGIEIEPEQRSTRVRLPTLLAVQRADASLVDQVRSLARSAPLVVVCPTEESLAGVSGFDTSAQLTGALREAGARDVILWDSDKSPAQIVSSLFGG